MVFMQQKKIDKHSIEIPGDLPILPVRNTVIFPFLLIPLFIGIKRSIKLIEDALQRDKLIGLVCSKDPEIEEPDQGQVFQIGTIARINHTQRDLEGNLHVLVEGIERFQVEKWIDTQPYLRAAITPSPDKIVHDLETEALVLSLKELSNEVISLSPNLSDEAGRYINRLDDPVHLIYLIAGNSGMHMEEGQKLLELDDVKDKLKLLISHLSHEKEVLSLNKKIKSNAKAEMGKAEKDYYLRQQMKAIKKELGENDDPQSETMEYDKKIRKAGLPEEAEREAQRELGRMKGMSNQSAEYPVIKTYLDWLIELPWNVLTEDQLDINHSRDVLDEDHYDLQDVKDRIIEYLAVRKLIIERKINDKDNEIGDQLERRGAILCFVGPPGVGKTSLGQSIARALGRKFTRMSLGGMRDEAEIRGHRRTYIGAMPGRIIQSIKRAGTRNPVFMLDEVDKIGSDWRGDPSSALLEVLDPAQNHAFRDHYLDLDFDLSDVIFIATANQLETIPGALRDRMEIINLDGYTEYEKILIAKNHLVSRQIRSNGLRDKEITFTDEALKKIISHYTRESGVRNLERQIGSVCRKAALDIAAKLRSRIHVTPDLISKYLKKELFESELSESMELPGIATGLSVTSVGGDILFIEATNMKGTGKLTLTGQLGDVMRESAQIAYSYVKSKSEQLHIDTDVFGKTDIHLHVPAGAIPKDGPSAGITMVMAIASLLSESPVRNDTGMTGEITLRGRVLPVGGIKMKVLAAHRAGLKKIIMPKRNEKDLDELPDEIRSSMNFIFVEHIDEAFKWALNITDDSVDIHDMISTNEKSQPFKTGFSLN